MPRSLRFDPIFVLAIGFLIVFSIFILRSTAPGMFPVYLFFIFLSILAFIIFSFIDFEVISVFSKHLYIGSIILLLLTFILGRVTRGVVRWIPIGSLTIQAAEIVKPFLLVFFSNYLIGSQVNGFRIVKSLVLALIPVMLILIQPSFSVGFLLATGFLGVFIASNIDKKYFLYLIVFFTVFFPLIWFLLAPYQKVRITGFLNPYSDPQGAGYNSIQAVIAVGSGGFLGRGLGKGVQTQLSFLPEKYNDFIFAAISEELGFIGGFLVIIAFFLILFRLSSFIGNAVSPQARGYLAGIFTTLITQIFIHIGMNLGVLPITGLPLPLVSGGGSSLLATMIALGIALGARRR